MHKTLFRLLIVNKEALASAMSSAFQAGESANPLKLTVEGNHYTAFDVPTDIQSLQAVVHNYGKAPLPSGYGMRPLAQGDIILDSNGKALVLAGEGDFNDVTSKVSSFVEFPTNPNATNSAVVASSDDDDEDEEPEDDEDEGEDEPEDEGIVKASAAYPPRSLRVGAIANPRNAERVEIQALMTEAIGKMFEAQNIPMNKNHSRRAVRAAMRIGIRLALEEGQNLHSMLSLFSECIQKESKELGKKTGKATIAMVQIDE